MTKHKASFGHVPLLAPDASRTPHCDRYAKIPTTKKIVASVVQNTKDDRRTPPIALMIFNDRCARIVAITDSPARKNTNAIKTPKHAVNMSVDATGNVR